MIESPAADTVSWEAPDGDHPARRAAAQRFMPAVAAGHKAGWLSLFTPDALVEDPVSAPGESGAFNVRTTESSDLRALVRLDEFQQAPFRVQQFAAWTITDNPAHEGFVSLGAN